MARLQAGDTVVVTALDRISRRALDGLRFIQDLADAGVHLVVLAQPEFDTSKPTRKLLLHVALAIAEWEWSSIRQRSIQGQERARAEGKRIGRPPVLTGERRDEVPRRLQGGESVTRLAKLYGVHHTVVRRLKRELEEQETG